MFGLSFLIVQLLGGTFETVNAGIAGTDGKVLVNESLARRYYPGESAIGRRVDPSGSPQTFLEIVGVVADVKQAGLDEPAGTEVYFHYPQAASFGGVPGTMNFVVATEGDPTALASAARRL